MKRLISLLLCMLLTGQLLAVCSFASDKTPYSDVQTSDWFSEAVFSMYAQGIMYGTDALLFSPNELTTRAMAVTVLYRLEGQPASGSSSFVDVSAQDYFSEAVAWASEHGIVYGTDAQHFSPDENVTREQLVTFLYRYIQYKGSSAEQRSNLNIYQDRNTIDTFAEPAVRWSAAVGLISGRSSTILAPCGSTTRAELAQMIYNLQNKVLGVATAMNPDTTVVPVLSFHSVQDDTPNAYSVSTAEFASVMAMLSEANYHSVSLQQLVDYVDGYGSLPENPILITFDDGYQDNLDNACPILEKYGFCAVISVIGCYVGCNSYNGQAIIPHFSLESASTYVPVTISIESHTNKMHMLTDYTDLTEGRSGVAKRDSETEAEYSQRLLADFTDSYNLIADAIGAPLCLTYPYGIFTPESEAAAKQAGYRVTMTTRKGVNVITRDDPSSLYLLNRISISRTYTADAFQTLVTSYYYD